MSENQEGTTALSLRPRRLSPSRASDYAQCPKLFFHRSIEKRTSPPTVATAAGNLTHLVCEKIFDLPPQERTLEMALSMVGDCWTEMLSVGPDEPLYLQEAAIGQAALAPAGSPELAEIIQIARESLTGWFQMETPSGFTPDARELALEAEFDGYRFGGILDRLDTYIGTIDGEKRELVAVTDYKTGSVPNEHFDPGFKKAFSAMVLYAALLKKERGVDVHMLRLLYIRTGDKALGLKVLRITDGVREEIVETMTEIYKKIEKSLETGTWTPKVSALCGWCSFVTECPEGTAEVARRAAVKAEREAAKAAREAAQDTTAVSF